MTAKVIDITIRHHNDHGTARSANSDEFSDNHPRLFEGFQGVGTKDTINQSFAERKFQNRMLDEFSVRQQRLSSANALFGKAQPVRVMEGHRCFNATRRSPTPHPTSTTRPAPLTRGAATSTISSISLARTPSPSERNLERIWSSPHSWS